MNPNLESKKTRVKNSRERLRDHGLLCAAGGWVQKAR